MKSTKTAAVYTLFFNHHCPPCCSLSWLVVVLSLGAIKRKPVNEQNIKIIKSHCPEWSGELMLLGGQKIWLANQAFWAIPAITVLAYQQKIRTIFRTCFSFNRKGLNK